jgi:hypothetical protein
MSATFGVGEILPNKASRTGDGIALRVESLISDEKQTAHNRTGYESHSKLGDQFYKEAQSVLCTFSVTDFSRWSGSHNEILRRV